MARFLFSVDSINQPRSAQFMGLAEWLASRGHSAVVLCSNPGAGPSDYRVGRGRGVSVISWPHVPPIKLADGVFFWRLLRDFRPHCVTAQFRSVNWVVGLGWASRVPVRVAWARTLAGQKEFVSSSRLRFRYYAARRRLVYRMATHIATVSAATLPELQEWFGVDQSKCTVVPNSLLPPECLAHAPSTPRLVSVGRLAPIKGHSVLIEALALMKPRLDQPCELVLVGDGSQRDELSKLAEEFGVGSMVRFAGRLPHHQAMGVLAGATACVHPSLSEAFGFAVLEAMSLGVPIVASDVGGIPEVVGPSGGCALLVRPGEPQDLAAALLEVIGGDDLRSKMSEEGRRLFREKYTAEAWASNVGSWLEREVETRRS